MSQEGLQNLKRYFSADKPNIHDPFFMAQFLIIPTNTIVKNIILPWLQDKLVPKGEDPDEYVKKNICRGKNHKAEGLHKILLIYRLDEYNKNLWKISRL